ncbi:MAG: hypothetical protein Q9216_002428 [Gyalolechia sp. 2 TL-2023]
MARSISFVIWCIAMKTATVFANPVDNPILGSIGPTEPNLVLNAVESNFEVKCDGTRFGRNLKPSSCADVQGRIPTTSGNLVFGRRGRRGVSIVTPWRWISCKFSDVHYGKGHAEHLVGLADGLCAIEVAETPEARGSSLDLATAADEMNQLCVDFSERPEGSIASNIGKASELGMRDGDEGYADLLVGVDGKLTLTMRSYRPTVECRRPIIMSDQESSDEILRRMPAMAGNTVFGRRGIPGVRVTLPLTFTSSE